MKLEELAAECKRQQELQGKPDAMVVLCLPGGARTERRRLFGQAGGPMGQVVGTREFDSQVAFDADKILAWLDNAKVLAP